MHSGLRKVTLEVCFQAQVHPERLFSQTGLATVKGVYFQCNFLPLRNGEKCRKQLRQKPVKNCKVVSHQEAGLQEALG